MSIKFYTSPKYFIPPPKKNISGYAPEVNVGFRFLPLVQWTLGHHYTKEHIFLVQELSFLCMQMVLTDKQMMQYAVNISGEWRTISPEYIGSLILKQLRETAERNLTIPLHRAVMAVPAEFDEQQRNFTKSAAQLAGGTLLTQLAGGTLPLSLQVVLC